MAFYGYPEERWVHLRTTNPIESTFATMGLQQGVTKGPGSRAAGVATAFEPIKSAQTRWRAVNAPHPVALVRVGARFEEASGSAGSSRPSGPAADGSADRAQRTVGT